MMKKLAITVAGVGAMVAAAVGLAGAAAAAPGARADEAVNALQGQGYSVQLSETPNANLSACTVTNVSGLSDVAPAGANPTAFVEIACPEGC